MTSALLGEALAPLRRDPQRAAVLLDIDGTLAPIVEQPSEAVVSEQTRQLLSAAARRYAVVACVTGRRASDARALVGVGSVSYLGSHGSELLRAGWTEPVLDPALEDCARRIHEFVRGADAPELRRLRIRIEDKGAIAAFHWRGAPDEAAARSAIDSIARNAEATGLRTHWGRKVLEVRPPVRIDKGVGVTSFLEQEEVDSALYIGDDATDLDAFRSLRELVRSGALSHAVTVGVSSDEGPEEIVSEADLVVDGPEGAHELLVVLTAS